jgi:YjbE family integral membrane protein
MQVEFVITYWDTLLEIFMINLILSGDNAVVIALATVHLEEKDRKKGIFWGTSGAVILRILLTAGAVLLLELPFIQAVGGILLLSIAFKLLKGEEKGEQLVSRQSHSIRDAVRTIIIADLLMSLDNVLAVAGAAGGNISLLMLGLGISIPIVIFGSTFLSALMRKWPWLISVGAGLLGYTAGEMILKDQACASLSKLPILSYGIPWVLTAGVIVAGYAYRRYSKKDRENPSQRKDLLQENYVQVINSKPNQKI